MGRRGEEGLGFIRGAVLVGLILIIAVVLLRKTISDGVVDTISCPATTSCKESAGLWKGNYGCPDGTSREFLKFTGCEKGQICCLVDKGDAGGDDGFVAPTVRINVYELTQDPTLDANGNFEKTSVTGWTLLPGGSSANIYGNRPKAILVEAVVENCEGAYREMDSSSSDSEDQSGNVNAVPTSEQGHCKVEKDHFTFNVETASGQSILTDVARKFSVSLDRTSIVGNPLNIGDGDLILKNIYDDGTDFLAIRSDDVYLDGETDDDNKKFFTTRGFLFQIPEEYNGETVSFTITATVPYANPKNNIARETKAETKILFKPKPIVRYGPLTQQWEKSKTITIACEKPVNCDNAYFMVLDPVRVRLITPESSTGWPGLPYWETHDDAQAVCPVLTSEELQNKKVVDYDKLGNYCLVDRTGQTKGGCWSTLEACQEFGLAKLVDSNYATARQIILSGVKSGVLPEELSVVIRDLQQFQEAESKSSTISCQRSLPTESTTTNDGKPTYAGYDTIFKAPKITSTDPRWRVTLDMPFMTGQYLCVYGEERLGGTSGAGSTTRSEFYTAGKPQRLYIDRIPPTATIKFNPWTLVISVKCEDSESGCRDDGWGYAYINDLTAFIHTLAREANSKSAAIWCPAYAAGTGYAHQSQWETIYNVPEVRVLCARVEDRAGNAGVTLTTVYNSYDIFFGLLAKYVQEEQKDQRSGLPP